METVMLCLNQLGIGGVETAAFNQTIQLIRRGYKVVVVAKDGIYKEKFEEEGAICINFEFEIKSKYDIYKINRIQEIIKKYNVKQVHIHQFDCISTVFPASIFCNIPYVAYIHTGILGVYDWFENSYPGYDKIFKLYFELSERIVAITEQAKQENIKKYNISNDKYIIRNNSIDFEKISSIDNGIPKKIQNVLIVSRFSKEKMTSIQNAILIFDNYLKVNTNAKLTIIGDGKCKEDVEKMVKTFSNSVEMLGQRNDINNIMPKYDLIIALDRCVLEGIAMKKLCIISGYDGIKGLVIPEKVEKLSKTNFSGRGCDNQDINAVIEQIINLDEKKIKYIVERNYEFAYKNLNASNNLYVIESEYVPQENLNAKQFMNTIIEIQNLYVERINKEESDWKEWEKAKKWYEGQIELEKSKAKNKQNEIEQLKHDLEEIYKSKTWKIANKIKKFYKEN